MTSPLDPRPSSLVPSQPFIHPLSDVQSKDIGDGTRIWQFCVVLPGAKIGKNCNICANCFIENDVVIGDNVTIKCGVQLWDGMRIEDNVFIGANATFCNDRHPRSGNSANYHLEPVVIRKGAMVGASAIILPGVMIGENAIIGAGSVVTHDILPSTTHISKLQHSGDMTCAHSHAEPMSQPRHTVTGRDIT